MKPTKNQIYCIGCKKTKMLFESQSKANNFIKFNSQEILDESGTAPVRSYYCSFCSGWHVTSNPSIEIGEKIDAHDSGKWQKLEREDKMKEEMKLIRSKVYDKLKECCILMCMCEFDKAEDLLDMMNLSIDDLVAFHCNFNITNEVRARVSKYQGILKTYREIYTMDEDGQKAILDNDDPTKEEKKVIAIVQTVRAVRMITSVLDNESALIYCPDDATVEGIISKCREYIECIKGKGSEKARQRFSERLDAILEKRQ